MDIICSLVSLPFTSILLFASLNLAPSTSSAESFLCLAEIAAGLSKRDERWESTTFKPTDRFIVKRDEVTEFSWVVKSWDGDVIQVCEKDFNEHGYLECTVVEGGSFFTMNRRNLRFLISQPHGYVNEEILGRLDPVVQGGSCALLPE